VKLILTFLADYNKYFGKRFIYDETDYLEVSRREAREIESILALIRGNDAQSL
jgi:hypothetical protein